MPEILSGYNEGQIFSLMEGKRTCETRGLERERDPANQSEGRRKWKMDDDKQRKRPEERHIYTPSGFESIS